MPVINKILITGDFLRQRQFSTGISSQAGNIKWLYHVVRPALSMLTDFLIAPVLFTGDGSCLGAKIFFVE